MPEKPKRRRRIELHGWDSSARAWHGPDELTFALDGCGPILRKLRELPGSWHGRLPAKQPGEPLVSVCAAIYDLGDAGLATIDIEGSPGGPLEVLLVIPAHRRSAIRPEMAFEFVSFLRFLEGRDSLGTEVAVHDYIERVLADGAQPATLVFSIETRPVLPEVRLLISQQAERLAMSMIECLAGRDGPAHENAAA